MHEPEELISKTLRTSWADVTPQDMCETLFSFTLSKFLCICTGNKIWVCEAFVVDLVKLHIGHLTRHVY